MNDFRFVYEPTILSLWIHIRIQTNADKVTQIFSVVNLFLSAGR